MYYHCTNFPPACSGGMISSFVVDTKSKVTWEREVVRLFLTKAPAKSGTPLFDSCWKVFSRENSRWIFLVGNVNGKQRRSLEFMKELGASSARKWSYRSITIPYDIEDKKLGDLNYGYNCCKPLYISDVPAFLIALEKKLKVLVKKYEPKALKITKPKKYAAAKVTTCDVFIEF